MSEIRDSNGQLQQAGVKAIADAPPGNVRWVDRPIKAFAHWPDQPSKFIVHYEACDCAVCEASPRVEGKGDE